MTCEPLDIAALIASRQQHKPGDYINPCINGERVVLRIIEKHERGVTFLGYEDVVTRYICVDSAGDAHNVGISDDPRAADADQIAAFTDSVARRRGSDRSLHRQRGTPMKRELLTAMVVAGLCDVRNPPSLVQSSGLTALEMLIMRNIVDGAHLRGVSDANKTEHDAALIDLLKRGLVSYHKKRARRFDLTPTGCEALATAEEKQGEVLGATETVAEDGKHV